MAACTRQAAAQGGSAGMWQCRFGLTDGCALALLELSERRRWQRDQERQCRQAGEAACGDTAEHRYPDRGALSV